MKYCQDLTTWWLHHLSIVHIKILFAFHLKYSGFWPSVDVKWSGAGNTKGGSITVLLTFCLTFLESAVWQLKIFLFICNTDRSKPVKQEVKVQWYFPLPPCLVHEPFGSACLLSLCVWYDLFVSVVNAIKTFFISVSDAMMFKFVLLYRRYKWNTECVRRLLLSIKH
jgi:hypothetical protein